jgi:hypothetical protein
MAASSSAMRNAAIGVTAAIQAGVARWSERCSERRADTTVRDRVSGTPDAQSLSYSNFDTKGDFTMPYLLGWLLGVPLIVLVILYLIFH